MDINLLWDIKISPCSDNRYIIREEIKYIFEEKVIIIPEGYKTNGANIPRIFWWFIPPFKPKNIPAVIFHDYLCDLEDYRLADDVFEDILLKTDNNISHKVMVIAVRLYHKVRYGV